MIKVDHEASVADYLMEAIEKPCVRILDAVYGVRARFIAPRGALKLGSPDKIIWFTRGVERSRARLMIETKTPWALPTHPGLDLATYYNKHRRNFEKDPIIKAVHQAYGYMTLNSLKYGILTNAETTYIFRRMHNDTEGPPKTGQGGYLECSPAISLLGQGLESPIAAYAFISALSYEEGWLHRSLEDDFDDVPTEFKLDSTQPILAPLPIEKPITNTKGLTFQLGKLLSSSVASTMRGTILHRGNPICNCIIKTYDLAEKRAEEMYHELSHMQGSEIPRLYIKGELAGLIGILALEDCGETLEGKETSAEAKKAVQKILRKMHAVGVLHNDLSLRNIVMNQHAPSESAFRLIDFGLATFATNKGKLEEEMAMVDQIDLC
ncbi:hypothetical protein Dda_8809 [Drechslerella dactyloides]|uniref:EKC/KEOPS complex subunit BUD32 n=1 Tax=Drechslerella dactyloides TaxID=74499 RepID=A0AAD6IQ93_DREDA|nr:hypothetical protein Dda_8809 [Drechslerella dactyloides]